MFRTRGIVLVTELQVALTRIVFWPVSFVDWTVVLLPPQPSTPQKETDNNNRTASKDGMLRLPLLILHKQNSENGKSTAPIPWPQSTPAEAVALELIERDVFASPLAVIIVCGGLKLQVMPIGKPVQLKVIVPFMPN